MTFRHIFLGIGAIAAASAAQASSLSLDTGSLPSAQGWTYIAAGPNSSGEAAYYAATGSSSDQDTLGDPTSFAGGAFYEHTVSLPIDGNFTVTARAIVRQYEGVTLGGGTTFPFGFAFGLASTYVALAGERLATYSASEGVRYYDIPAGFSIYDAHDYVLKSNAGHVTLRADGQLLLSATLGGSHSGSDELLFGDATGFANAAGRWYSLRCTSGAVPEPMSWAMMLLGFGFTGRCLRRHRMAILTA